MPKMEKQLKELLLPPQRKVLYYIILVPCLGMRERKIVVTKERR